MGEQPNQNRRDEQATLSRHFIGRDRELASLRLGFERVAAGHGEIILVAGEPGIGKTRLVTEFSATLVPDAALVLWGRCEGWDGAPAYWPWIQIVRSSLANRLGASERSRMSSTTHDIRRILSEVDALAPVSNLPTMLDPEQNRIQVINSITAFLLTAAVNQPLVIVLDDLHRADAPSLAVLLALSQEIDDTRVFVIGTYRHSEVSRKHPLSDTFASLIREPRYQRFALHGLSGIDVGHIVERALGHEPNADLVQTIYQRTDGNPFFLTEVVRLMTSGDVTSHMDSVEAALRRIPDGVRDVIRHRLDRLSPECNHLLALGAIIGREFGLSLLSHISGYPVQYLMDHLETASSAGIIEARRDVGSYRFSHALLREAIYDELPASQRVELHLRVAEALEAQHQEDLEPHYAELAHHFGAAAHKESIDKAIKYARKAADSALSQHVWEMAVDHYQHALQLHSRLESPRPAERCDILIALGEAQNWSGKGRGLTLLAGSAPEALATFWEAVRLARRLGIAEQLARAALGLAGPSLTVPHSREPGLRMIEEALDALPAEDSSLRARLLARSAVDAFRLWSVGDIPLDAFSIERIKEQSNEAVAVARRVGDPRTIAYTQSARYLAHEGPDSGDDWLTEADDILRIARLTNDFQLATSGSSQKYGVLVQAGLMGQATRVLAEGQQLKDRAPTPLNEWRVTVHQAGEALRHGRLSDAEALIDKAHVIWPQTAVTAFQRTTLYREQGRIHEADELIQLRLKHLPNSTLWRAMRVVCLLDTGRADAARSGFEDMASNSFGDLPRGFLWLRTVTWLAEIAAELEDEVRALHLYDLLLPYARQNVFTSNSDHTGGSVSYYLGLLAVTMSRHDAAGQHFRDALYDNKKWGVRPYVAYSLYAEGNRLFRRGDENDAIGARESLSQAIDLAQELGMVRLLNRAQILQQRVLQSGPLPEYDDAAQYPYGLSSREIDVLRLIVTGQTDREIARALFISPRTVGSHVSHILGKLDVNTRTEAAAIAVRERLE